MPVSAYVFCVCVVHVYVVCVHTCAQTCTHMAYARIAYFFVHAGEIRNVFNMHMNQNVNLPYCDTRHTFGACVWSLLMAPKT